MLLFQLLNLCSLSVFFFFQGAITGQALCTKSKLRSFAPTTFAMYYDLQITFISCITKEATTAITLLQGYFHIESIPGSVLLSSFVSLLCLLKPPVDNGR
ncbi:hypothetical protein ILYODFUR_036529 [Ilyodon furcidens]|uniref:Secreted protein n=1 Tax=Ilyodon furcidens TaxID=33524 RepID=A0ABV0UDC2_9TELE